MEYSFFLKIFLSKHKTKRMLVMKRLSLSLAIAAIAGFATVANAAMADGGAKFLGNITTGGQIRSDFAQYWNQITPENGCKWGSIHSLSNGNSGTSKFAWDNFDKCEAPTSGPRKNRANATSSSTPSFGGRSTRTSSARRRTRALQ